MTHDTKLTSIEINFLYLNLNYFIYKRPNFINLRDRAGAGSNSESPKNQRSAPPGCEDIGIISYLLIFWMV